MTVAKLENCSQQLQRQQPQQQQEQQSGDGSNGGLELVQSMPAAVGNPMAGPSAATALPGDSRAATAGGSVAGGNDVALMDTGGDIFEAQRDFVANTYRKPLIKGDSWFLLDHRWFKQWKKYVGFDKWETGSIGEASASPGPIDNSALFKDNSSDPEDLREHLIDELDYVLMPKEVWTKLVDWYGLAPNQQPIERTVVDYGMFLESMRVEIYKTELKLGLNSDKNNLKSRKFSKTATLEHVEQVIRELFNVPENAKTRLWYRFAANAFEVIKDRTRTIQDESLYSAQAVFLEVQNPDGTWPRSAVGKLVAQTQNDAESVSASMSMIRKPSMAGLCGLINLGNTCFMNAALQCMSNTPPLTQYFLTDRYQRDINRENPLGMHGEIAEAYAELIKALWSGDMQTFQPKVFKQKVGRFAPQFHGYIQQDCQELMAFLLDGLHEDLNRVKKKPYIEAKSADGRPDELVAYEAWSNYLKRNDSIVTDTFHGLLKSTLVCPECMHVSVTFDPFCYLSLPLPNRKEKCLTAVVFPCIQQSQSATATNYHCQQAAAAASSSATLGASGASPLTPYRVRVYVPLYPARCSGAKLYSIVARAIHGCEKRLVIAVMETVGHHERRVKRLVEPYEDDANTDVLSDVTSTDSNALFVYEMPVSPWKEGEHGALVRVYMREIVRRDSSASAFSTATMFGIPFYIYVQRPARPSGSEAVQQQASSLSPTFNSTTSNGAVAGDNNNGIVNADSINNNNNGSGCVVAGSRQQQQQQQRQVLADKQQQQTASRNPATPTGTANDGVSTVGGGIQVTLDELYDQALAWLQGRLVDLDRCGTVHSLDGWNSAGAGTFGAATAVVAASPSMPTSGVATESTGESDLTTPMATSDVDADDDINRKGALAGIDEQGVDGIQLTMDDSESGVDLVGRNRRRRGRSTGLRLFDIHLVNEMCNTQLPWGACSKTTSRFSPASLTTTSATNAATTPLTASVSNGYIVAPNPSSGHDGHGVSVEDVSELGSAPEQTVRERPVMVTLRERSYITLDWLPKWKQLVYDESKFMTAIHRSIVGMVRAGFGMGPSGKRPVELYECLELFTTTEKLGADDLWYCPKCLKHQQATKKFDLWSLPQILIIHLKRFSYNRYFRDKLDTLVRFPIKDLRLGPPIVLDPRHDRPVSYDLIGVANHYGGLGGGHYTAYAKNKHSGKWYDFDDSQVSPIPDSRIVSNNAYVLFYMRQDAGSTSGNNGGSNVSGGSSVDAQNNGWPALCMATPPASPHKQPASVTGPPMRPSHRQRPVTRSRANRRCSSTSSSGSNSSSCSSNSSSSSSNEDGMDMSS